MPIEQIIDSLLATVQVRAKSTVVTVFGDSIVPRGGKIWLADLITLMAPFGINDRMVRTAVYRLTQDGYFSTEKHGRQSLYTLTDDGSRIFAAAERRIYATAQTIERADWTFLFLTSAFPESRRKELAKQLGWEGLSQISSSVFAAPSDKISVLEDTLTDLSPTDGIVMFRAEPTDNASKTAALSKLVEDAWPLRSLAGLYVSFQDLLHPIETYLGSGQQLTPQQAFVLRTLIVHAYRRLLLKHPTLPSNLLPKDWPGTKAMQMYQNIYRSLLLKSEKHVDLLDLPNPDKEHIAYPILAKRFGGLPELRRGS